MSVYGPKECPKFKRVAQPVDNRMRDGTLDLSYKPQTAMGRKLNVALLLAMHLGFFACAGLIVGPLLTDGANQGSSTSIAVSPSKLGGEVNTDVSAQENVAQVRFREGFSGQRDRLGLTVDQPIVDQWRQTDPQSRERLPFAQRRTP